MDVAARRLRRGTAELELRPQAFRALNLLIQNAGRYVNHDQMIREAWDGISVSRNTISVTIAEVKKTLQEYGGWIRCRPKLGYVLEVPRGEDLIKKGWHLWERRTREGLEKALACFDEAAAENPSDFRAFEGISLSYLLLCTYGMRPPLDTYPKFLEAHNRAVALGGLTTALRSTVAMRCISASASWTKPKLNCCSVTGRAEARNHLCPVGNSVFDPGRLDDALEMIQRGRAADPLCPVLLSTETFIRLCRHEFDEAAACGKSSIDLHPYQHVGVSIMRTRWSVPGASTKRWRNFGWCA